MNISKYLLLSTAVLGLVNPLVVLADDQVTSIKSNISSSTTSEKVKSNTRFNKSKTENSKITNKNSKVNTTSATLDELPDFNHVSNMYVDPASNKMSYGAKGYLNLRLYSAEIDQYVPKTMYVVFPLGMKGDNLEVLQNNLNDIGDCKINPNT